MAPWCALESVLCHLTSAEGFGDQGSSKQEALAVPTCPWQAWLLEWEERQRQQLQRHEAATQEFLEALRRDLLEDRVSRRKSKIEAKDRPVAEGPEIEKKAVGHVDWPTSSHACRPEYKPQASLKVQGMTSYSDLNKAMVSACGGSRHGAGEYRALERLEKAVTGLQKFAAHMGRQNNNAPSFLKTVVKHRYFVITRSLLICLYTIAVGVMADLDMRTTVAVGQPSPYSRGIDFFFTACFGIEVGLRLGAEGFAYFTNREKAWNIFDLGVALFGLLDLCAVFNLNLAFLRILRTFRAVRVLRVVRVFTIFKELRLMVTSICACMVSLTWAFMLLAGVMYIFAVVLLKGSSDHLQQGNVDPDLYELLATDFGTMPRTVYSLTQAVSGGRSWGQFADAFIVISPWYGVCFTIFVVFVIFGVMNILTGLFVERAQTVANFDKELFIQEEMSRNESTINQMRQLFKELDVDNSGTVTCEELEANLHDERVKAYFGLLQMDISEAQGLFELLDRDGSGEVSIEEFIMSCMRLKGAAKSIDLAAMLFESKRLHTTMKQFMTNIEDLVRDVQEKVAQLAED